jgi:hypothetical protein
MESRFNEGFVAFDLHVKLAEYARWPKRIRIRPINGLTHSQIEAKWTLCLRYVEEKLPYAKTQFLGYLGSEIFGWPMPDTPSDAVCSESTARVLEHGTNIFDFRSSRNRTFDSFTPVEIWDAANETIDAVEANRRGILGQTKET